MNVSELINLLQQEDPNKEVFVECRDFEGVMRQTSIEDVCSELKRSEFDSYSDRWVTVIKTE